MNKVIPLALILVVGACAPAASTERTPATLAPKVDASILDGRWVGECSKGSGSFAYSVLELSGSESGDISGIRRLLLKGDSERAKRINKNNFRGVEGSFHEDNFVRVVEQPLSREQLPSNASASLVRAVNDNASVFEGYLDQEGNTLLVNDKSVDCDYEFEREE